MHPFPHRYEVGLTGDGPLCHLDSPGRPTIAGGAPPEFDGDPTVWSPEHLLLASVGLCLFTTFRALAGREPALVYEFYDRVAGTLEKTPQGPRFSSIIHTVELVVAASDRDRADKLLQCAERHCIVTASLNVPVCVERRICVSSSLTSAREPSAA